MRASYCFQVKSLLEEVAQQTVANAQVEETTVKVQHPAIAAMVKPGEKMADLFGIV